MTAVLPFLMITVALLVVVILAVALTLVIMQRGAHAAPHKPKRRLEEEPRDPYPDDLADEGRLVLDDDGELPDWIDDLAEKPKRADRE